MHEYSVYTGPVHVYVFMHDLSSQPQLLLKKYHDEILIYELTPVNYYYIA